MLRILSFVGRLLYFIITGYRWSSRPKKRKQPICIEVHCYALRCDICKDGRCSRHCHMYCFQLHNKSDLVRKSDEPFFVLANSERWALNELIQELRQDLSVNRSYAAEKLLKYCARNSVPHSRAKFLIEVMDLHYGGLSFNQNNCSLDSCYACRALKEYKPLPLEHR